MYVNGKTLQAEYPTDIDGSSSKVLHIALHNKYSQTMLFPLLVDIQKKILAHLYGEDLLHITVESRKSPKNVTENWKSPIKNQRKAGEGKTRAGKG